MLTAMECILTACERGNLEDAKKLHDDGINIHEDHEEAFRGACKNGHIEIAKWLQSLGANINALDNSAFIWCCINNNIEIAKWLHSLGTDIHAQSDAGFRYACYYGHTELAKWLQSLGVNIHAHYDYAFSWICINRHLKLAKWLIETEKFDNRIINEHGEYLIPENLIKVVFDNCYFPTNDLMREEYLRYKKETVKDLKTIVKNQYLLPELWDLVYEY
jgi:ankyrin repeat protein